MSQVNHEPQQGEPIQLLDVDGLYRGRIARVLRIVSQDVEMETYEIMDNFNRCRYIQSKDIGGWWEVDLET